MLQRFGKLREPLQLMAQTEELEEYRGKLNKIKNRDWIVIENVVAVLQVYSPFILCIH